MPKLFLYTFINLKIGSIIVSVDHVVDVWDHCEFISPTTSFVVVSSVKTAPEHTRRSTADNVTLCTKEPLVQRICGVSSAGWWVGTRVRESEPLFPLFHQFGMSLAPVATPNFELFGAFQPKISKI